MKEDEFFCALREAADVDDKTPLDMGMKLESLPTWDSLALISFIAALDLKHGIVTSAQTVRGCATLKELFKAIGTE